MRLSILSFLLLLLLGCFGEPLVKVDVFQAIKETVAIQDSDSMATLTIMKERNIDGSLFLFNQYEQLADQINHQDRKLLQYQSRKRHYYLKSQRYRETYQRERYRLEPYRPVPSRINFQQMEQRNTQEWQTHYPAQDDYRRLVREIDSGLHKLSDRVLYQLPANQTLLMIAEGYQASTSPQLLRIELKENHYYWLTYELKQHRQRALKKPTIVQYGVLELYESMDAKGEERELVATTEVDDYDMTMRVSINPYAYLLLLDYLQIQQIRQN